jgi:Asp-tRNA(Asn)/Glu-tRNA(Gln) amidotransferase A subunit family amidase
MDAYPFFGELMDQMNEPAAAAGIPAINVPVGLCESMPVGMQIMAPRLRELRLLQVAHTFELETGFFGVREHILNKYPQL